VRCDQRQGRSAHHARGRRRPALPGGLIRTPPPGEQAIELRDGSRVDVRAVRAADKDAIRSAFEHLAPESRYARFLALFDTLSDAQLRYLTEVDHHDHEALVAYEPEGGRGVAVARYVRSPKDPAVAEAAVVVDDGWQGRGLGTELVRLLADRAREEGIDRFDATLLADNERVLNLLRSLGPARVVGREGATIAVQIQLPPRGVGEPMRHILRAVARGAARLAPGTGLAKS
jgi:RimJ/RimL family protein N-acetyltransferase